MKQYFLSKMNNLRQLSLRAGNVTLPGRNLATSEEGNIYGPNREIVEGVSCHSTTMLLSQSINLQLKFSLIR